MSTIARRAAALSLASALSMFILPLQAGWANQQSAALPGPEPTPLTKACRLDNFTERAKKNGWLVQELTGEERANFLDHLNHDGGERSNFYPAHLWETVQKKGERIHIRVVFLDDRNCVLGNSGEIGFHELSYLLAPDMGF